VPVAFIAYWHVPQWERVADVTTESEVVLHPRGHQNSVYGVDIYVYGQIEGTAEMMVLEADKPYRVLKLSGAVDTRYIGDWYADELVLVYKPDHVTGGTLKVRYRFLPSYPLF
jgi:hypothetical protein